MLPEELEYRIVLIMLDRKGYFRLILGPTIRLKIICSREIYSIKRQKRIGKPQKILVQQNSIFKIIRLLSEGRETIRMFVLRFLEGAKLI